MLKIKMDILKLVLYQSKVVKHVKRLWLLRYPADKADNHLKLIAENNI